MVELNNHCRVFILGCRRYLFPSLVFRRKRLCEFLDRDDEADQSGDDAKDDNNIVEDLALTRYFILVGQVIDPNWQDEGESCAGKSTDKVDKEAEFWHNHGTQSRH